MATKPHGFPVAAIEREGYPDFLAIIAGEFEAIRTPAQVGAIDGNPAVVTTLLQTSRVLLQQQAVGLHDAIDALVIGCLEALRLGRAPQHSPDPPVAESEARTLAELYAL